MTATEVMNWNPITASAGITLVRGTLADAVVGFEVVTSVAVMVFALLAEGFKRPSLFEFPVIVAVLLILPGMILHAREIRTRFNL